MNKWETMTEDEIMDLLSDRDPKEFPFGYFSFCNAPPVICGSGAGGFSWFADKAEMLTFAAYGEPKFSSEADQNSAEMREYTKLFIDAMEDKIGIADLINKANEINPVMIKIEWIGDFQDLLQGRGEFAQKVITSFYEDEDDPGKFIPASVQSEDIDAFVEFLYTYGL